MASVVLPVLSGTLIACIFVFISTLLQAIEYIFSHLLLDYSFLALILTGRSVETHKGRFGRSASLSQLTIEDTAHVRRTMTEHMDRTVAILRTLPKEMLLVFRLAVQQCGQHLNMCSMQLSLFYHPFFSLPLNCGYLSLLPLLLSPLHPPPLVNHPTETLIWYAPLCGHMVPPSTDSTSWHEGD